MIIKTILHGLATIGVYQIWFVGFVTTGPEQVCALLTSAACVAGLRLIAWQCKEEKRRNAALKEIATELHNIKRK